MIMDNLDKAEAHTITAIRRLEMILWFIRNKKRVSPDKHIPAYFDSIANDLVQIQNAILSDDEYTEYVAKGLHYVSKTHTYAYNVVSNLDGDTFYDIDAMLPVKKMKETVLFARKDQW
jgi:hypothetical protein